MTIQDAITVINTVGFPIFCVLGLGFYVYKMNKENKEDREKTNEIIMNFALNMQANTNALDNLSEIIKDTVRKEENKDDVE